MAGAGSGPEQLRGAAVGAVMIGAGAVVAILPAAVQIAAARIFSTPEQAAVAVAVSVGAFTASLANAWVHESRLATPTIGRKTRTPVWATVLGSIGALALIALPGSVAATVLALPCIMTALQLGRTHAINQRRWRSELIAAAALGAGAVLTAFWAITGVAQALAAIGVASLLAVLVRLERPRRDGSPPHLSTRLWVTGETAIVAAVPLGATLIVQAAMGPAATVGFRMVLTVLGVLQPLLGYLRTRLLGAASPRLVLTMTVLSTVALGAVVVADLLGLLGAIFGPPWSVVTVAALCTACLWKAASLPATVPFAALRREGAVRQVFLVRVISTSVYLGLSAALASSIGSLTAVFAAFLIAEAGAALLYWRLASRLGPR